MTNNDKKLITNIIRAVVPSVVGLVGGYLAKHDMGASSPTAMALIPVIASGYYSGLRFLEKRYPKWGWLLGALEHIPAPKETPTETTK